MRAGHAGELGKIVQHHQNMYEIAGAPAYVQQEVVDLVTSLLSRHSQLYDASALEEQCARVKAWAQLVVRQGFVVKAEQLRAKQEKEKFRQRIRSHFGSRCFLLKCVLLLWWRRDLRANACGRPPRSHAPTLMGVSPCRSPRRPLNVLAMHMAIQTVLFLCATDIVTDSDGVLHSVHLRRFRSASRHPSFGSL